VSRIARNAPCPCESGRKYKRCCGAVRPEVDPRALSRGDMAVGGRIQEWAYANHRDEMDAALDELVGDRRGTVFDDADTQLLTSWQLNDRELLGGGTPAQRYARLAGLADSERATAVRIASARLAVLRVRSTEPGRAIEIEDVTRGGARVRVVSHEVSCRVQTNHMFVGHLMLGPPSVSLWGPMAMLDRRRGRELRDLLKERVAVLGLDPSADDVLGVAITSAALEVTRMLMPALRRPWRREARAA
jgi:SEC-C motif-containing protein